MQCKSGRPRCPTEGESEHRKRREEGYNKIERWTGAPTRTTGAGAGGGRIADGRSVAPSVPGIAFDFISLNVDVGTLQWPARRNRKHDYEVS